MSEAIAALGKPLMKLSGRSVRVLKSPIVYIWMRGAEPLYVGMSRNGITRPLTSDHRQLSGIQDSDHLLVFRMADEKTALAKEAELIEALRPRMNGCGNTGPVFTPATGGIRITTRDIAHVLGVSTDFVVTQIKSNALPALRVGREFRIEMGDAVRYLSGLNAPVPESWASAVSADSR